MRAEPTFCALVTDADLVVCGDTGVAHLVSAMGTPSVVLFGSVPASRWGPPPEGPHRVLTVDGARRGDAFAGDPDPALLDVSVEAVLSAASPLLAAGVSARSPAGSPGVDTERTTTMADEHRQAERMREDVPSTIARSDDKAVRTYKKTLESAEDSYGDDGERAHRAAYSSLKHTHEKVGDHWEPKDEAGPSDAQAARSGEPARRDPVETADGVDANASKEHLVDVARKVGIEHPERSRKDELVEKIRKANARSTRQARS